MKRRISILLCLALLAAMCTGLSACSTGDASNPKAQDYENALALLANCDYEGAKAAFEKLGDYQDAEEYLGKFYYMPVSYEYDLVNRKGTNRIYYNSSNLPSGEVVLRSDEQGMFEFEYDENGNLTHQIMNRKTEDGIMVSYYEYGYDENGYRVSAVYTSYDGNGVSYVFSYDEQGNNIAQTYSDANGTSHYTLTYDENGNVTRYELEANGVSEIYDIFFTYDDQGRIVREECTYPDGSQESLDNTYDQNGNRTNQVFTDYSGSQRSCEYTYDDHGNVIREVLMDADGNEQYISYEYELLYIPYGITAGTELFFRDFWASLLQF